MYGKGWCSGRLGPAGGRASVPNRGTTRGDRLKSTRGDVGAAAWCAQGHHGDGGVAQGDGVRGVQRGPGDRQSVHLEPVGGVRVHDFDALAHGDAGVPFGRQRIGEPDVHVPVPSDVAGAGGQRKFAADVGPGQYAERRRRGAAACPGVVWVPNWSLTWVSDTTEPGRSPGFEEVVLAVKDVAAHAAGHERLVDLQREVRPERAAAVTGGVRRPQLVAMSATVARPSTVMARSLASAGSRRSVSRILILRPPPHLFEEVTGHRR
jgi:hypothetical protein